MQRAALKICKWGIACLLSTDPSQATTLAQQLDQLNLARREIEADMQQQAIDFVEALPSHTLSEAQTRHLLI